MARGIARLHDQTIGNCSVHGSNIGGKIVTASANHMVNNRGVARLRDKVLADCGHEAYIITAAGTVKTNNRGTARLNDQVGDSPYTGKIVTASPNVDTDDSPSK